MRPQIRKSLAEFLKIWLFVWIFLLKAFPNTAYAFIINSRDACAAQPACAAAIASELAPVVAAPTGTGFGASTLSTTTAIGTTAASVQAVGKVAVVVGAVGGGYAVWHYWNQGNNEQAQNKAKERYCQANPTDSVCHGFSLAGQGQYQDCYPDGLHWEFTAYGGSYSYQTIFNGNPPHGANCYWDVIYIDGQFFTAFKPGTWIVQELQQTPWKDWPQEKRDAAVGLLEPSDWGNFIKSMPQGGLLEPGDTLDANKIVIPGLETDDPNTPEDDRPLRILPGIYTMPGNPDFDDDGLPDTTDPDDDNDGVPDASDLDPHNSNVPSPPTSASGGSSGSGDTGGSGDPGGSGAEVTPQVLQDISDIVNSFKPEQNLKCVECAQKIEDYLKGRNIRGERIKLDTPKTTDRNDLIIDDSVSANEAIADNGHHEGIEIKINEEKMVFDNHHPGGVPTEQWKSNLTFFGKEFLNEDFEEKRYRF
ncbi:papain fold toxin domain-containing protein [Scytonema sp. NUACC26]|uniref:papain fold toxin domain-containing protein n=1 Tax=Scytonema sp. NUACC26 TaxID=3140176 RepID=UPI0034DB81E5